MLAAKGSQKAFTARPVPLPTLIRGARASFHAKLKADVIAGPPGSKHVVFLHGLFGKGQSFQFIAKAKALQHSYTSHLVDLRNHGASEWHSEMDYKSLAEDLQGYVENAGLGSE